MAVLFPQSNTFEQLVNMFQEIADDMATFNSFGEGEISEITANTNSYYPLLWIEPNPVDIRETYTVYNFRVYAMDIVFQDLSNRKQVQGDALASLHHMIYMIRDNYRMQMDWSMQATPFIQMFNDMLAGYYMDLKILIPWSLGSCDIPLKQKYTTNRLLDDDGAYFVDADGGYLDWQNS